MNRELILPELRGRLWHTTHPDRFKSIIAGGAILPEPAIPDGERYCTGGGKDHYPYVRTLGGVSLFDFAEFDPGEYEKRNPSCNWAYFVPHHLHWGCAVWSEIDREQVATKLISGSALLAKWKFDGAYGHNIMPEIEAAYLGPVSTTAFKRAFLVRKEDDDVRRLPLRVGQVGIEPLSH